MFVKWSGTLGLDRVEKGKVLVEVLKGCVSQGRHGQRLQIQQLGGGWVFFWQNQVTERDRQLCLARLRRRENNSSETTYSNL